MNIDIEKMVSPYLHKGGRLFIALSGGGDSTALLHLCVQSDLREHVEAIHIHHGLSKNADEWVDHCKRECSHLSVPLTVKKVEVERQGKGLEAAAREARIQAISSSLNKGDVVLTGHHANDQAETLLYRIARGTGLEGLAGMHFCRPYGEGYVLRPLLGVSRERIERYLESHQLTCIEDESNKSEAFDRNFLRHSVVPKLNERWPNFVLSAQKCTELLRQNTELLAEYAAQDLDACDLKEERLGQSVSLEYYLQLSSARRHAMIRQWLARHTYLAPERVHFFELEKLCHAAKDAVPCLSLGPYCFRRFRQRMYLCPNLDLTGEQSSFIWDGASSISLAEGFSLQNCSQEALASQASFTIEFRRPGLRCKPFRRVHSQSVKKLFQEYGLEPWLRDMVPLVFFEGQLLAVGDLWTTDKGIELGLTQLLWRYNRET